MKQKIRKFLNNVWFELSIMSWPQGFRELFREERKIKDMPESREKSAKMCDLHQRFANGFAIRILYENDGEYNTSMHSYHKRMSEYYKGELMIEHITKEI